MMGSNSYICVVDDDDDIREALRCALEMFGYRVVEAADGNAALEVLRNEEGSCGLILLDLMMPAMNGWEFRTLQREDRALANIPVVILSGVQDTPGAAALAASDYVCKPIQVDVLVEVVAKQFRPQHEETRQAGPVTP